MSDHSAFQAPDPLVVGISSRALFDLDASHQVFEAGGIEAYVDYQIEHENEVLAPGIAFPLVKKLLALNDHRPEHPHVEVILLSRNSGDTGLRIFNAIEHHGLDICRAAFTNGESPFDYVRSFGAHLFLSTHADDVRRALDAGIAAATVPARAARDSKQAQLRIAFDGDAVLFSDESERITLEHGIERFAEHERARANESLSGGPFRPVLAAIHQIQSAYPADDNPIRTALITARSAPAHKRVIMTLRDWNIRIDEALFLGGRDKGQFLAAFGADIFFDDQPHNIESALEHVTAGHVPARVTNP